MKEESRSFKKTMRLEGKKETEQKRQPKLTKGKLREEINKKKVLKAIRWGAKRKKGHDRTHNRKNKKSYLSE